MTEPEQSEPEPTEESELPEGFHEPQETWSTEQLPGHMESTRTDGP